MKYYVGQIITDKATMEKRRIWKIDDAYIFYARNYPPYKPCGYIKKTWCDKFYTIASGIQFR